MYFSISDEMVSEFLSGLVVVLALVVVGCSIALILSRMSRDFPFSRLALVFALSPLAFFRFLEVQGSSTLYLYAMIVILLGITIDGISYLLEPKSKSADEEQKPEQNKPEEEDESKSGVIVWEKAK